MFSDFKGRGFGLEDSPLQSTDWKARLILVMTLALTWAVATGHSAAVSGPVGGRARRTARRKSRPTLVLRKRGLAA